MNKFIARFFARILAFIHVLAVVVVVLTLLYAIQTPQPGPIILSALAAFVLYVLIAGALTTLVSINEHLAEISRTLRTPARAPESGR